MRQICRWPSTLALFGLASLASSASATFHLMKIREVSSGTGTADSSYVEVQMYAPSRTSSARGEDRSAATALLEPDHMFCPASRMSPTATTRTRSCSATAASASGSKDFNVNLNLDSIQAGGAVCYLSEPGFTDCVSWGNFSANSTLIDQLRDRAPPVRPLRRSPRAWRCGGRSRAGCADGCSRRATTRTTAPPTSRSTTPNPRPNSVAPTEMPCGPGGAAGAGQPSTPPTAKKKKCKKRKPPRLKKKCKSRQAPLRPTRPRRSARRSGSS